MAYSGGNRADVSGITAAALVSVKAAAVVVLAESCGRSGRKVVSARLVAVDVTVADTTAANGRCR